MSVLSLSRRIVFWNLIPAFLLSAAHATTTTYNFYGEQVVIERNDQNLSDDSFHVYVTDFKADVFEDFYGWYESRKSRDEKKPLGTREYWLDENPTKPDPQTKRCLELFDQQPGRLTVQLKASYTKLEDVISDWKILECIRKKNSKVYEVLSPELYQFYNSHKADLRRLQKAVQEQSSRSRRRNSNEYVDQLLAGYALYFSAYQPEDSKEWRELFQMRNMIVNEQLPQAFKFERVSPVQIHKPVVFVTHAMSSFDDKKSIKRFGDKLISAAKLKGYDVVYLSRSSIFNDLSWFLEDRDPTFVLYSKNGEHDVQFDDPEPILIGGFFNQCFRTTQVDAITRYFLNHNGPLTLHMPLPGIYFHKSINFKKLKQKTFLKRVYEGSILGGYEIEDEDHGGMITSDMNLVTGIPDLKDYTVEIYTNDVKIKSEGSGPRIVKLKFWTEKEFWVAFEKKQTL